MQTCSPRFNLLSPNSTTVLPRRTEHVMVTRTVSRLARLPGRRASRSIVLRKTDKPLPQNPVGVSEIMLIFHFSPPSLEKWLIFTNFRLL
ncbi:hypothetical protein F5B21DRAFT_494178 [Xylaria acuta]|nr:hypothetical protein F5B21DRAFT_494178 [Xylaria acuta]